MGESVPGFQEFSLPPLLNCPTHARVGSGGQHNLSAIVVTLYLFVSWRVAAQGRVYVAAIYVTYLTVGTMMMLEFNAAPLPRNPKNPGTPGNPGTPEPTSKKLLL